MKKFFYWMWLIFSIMMIPVGIYGIMNPAATLISLSWLIGFSMLFQGICAIFIFCLDYGLPGSGWILFDGVITICLSLFLLFNQMFTAAALPYLFAMWILVSGIQKVVYSFDLKKFGMESWGWILTLGILLSIAGIVSLMNPVMGAIAISFLVGWMIIAYATVSIVIWFKIRNIINLM